MILILEHVCPRLNSIKYMSIPLYQPLILSFNFNIRRVAAVALQPTAVMVLMKVSNVCQVHISTHFIQFKRTVSHPQQKNLKRTWRFLLRQAWTSVFYRISQLSLLEVLWVTMVKSLKLLQSVKEEL